MIHHPAVRESRLHFQRAPGQRYYITARGCSPIPVLRTKPDAACSSTSLPPRNFYGAFAHKARRRIQVNDTSSCLPCAIEETLKTHALWVPTREPCWFVSCASWCGCSRFSVEDITYSLRTRFARRDWHFTWDCAISESRAWTIYLTNYSGFWFSMLFPFNSFCLFILSSSSFDGNYTILEKVLLKRNCLKKG